MYPPWNWHCSVDSLKQPVTEKSLFLQSAVFLKFAFENCKSPLNSVFVLVGVWSKLYLSPKLILSTNKVGHMVLDIRGKEAWNEHPAFEMHGVEQVVCRDQRYS